MKIFRLFKYLLTLVMLPSVLLVGSTLDSVAAASDSSVGLSVADIAAPVISPLPQYTVNSGNAINVSWSSVTGATEYYIEMATDPAFSSVVANSGWISGLTYTFSGVTDNTAYYFQVSSRNNVQQSGWSISTSTIYLYNVAPSRPTDPMTSGTGVTVNFINKNPTFSAIFNDPNPTDTATKYCVQVASSDLFDSSSIVWNSDSNSCSTGNVLTSSVDSGARSPEISYVGTELVTGMLYHWRIRFFDQALSVSPWSAARSFTTNPAQTISQSVAVSSGVGGGGNSISIAPLITSAQGTIVSTAVDVPTTTTISDAVMLNNESVPGLSLYIPGQNTVTSISGVIPAPTALVSSSYIKADEQFLGGAAVQGSYETPAVLSLPVSISGGGDPRTVEIVAVKNRMTNYYEVLADGRDAQSGTVLVNVKSDADIIAIQRNPVYLDGAIAPVSTSRPVLMPLAGGVTPVDITITAAGVSLFIPKGTAITTDNGSPFTGMIHPADLLAEPPRTLDNIAVNKSFSLGSPGRHLLFSPSVQLTFTGVDPSDTVYYLNERLYTFEPETDIAKIAAGVRTIRTNHLSIYGISKSRANLAFSDMNTNHWAYTAVNDLARKGIVGGYRDGSFGPNYNITRAEAAKIISEAANFPGSEGATTFKDVPRGIWYAPYLQVLVSHGVVSGYSDGTFRPNQPITRAEAVKLALVGLDDAPTVVYTNSFSDVRVGDWFNQYVSHAVKNGIVHGYLRNDGLGHITSIFHPHQYITRAEFAKIIDDILNKHFLKKEKDKYAHGSSNSSAKRWTSVGNAALDSLTPANQSISPTKDSGNKSDTESILDKIKKLLGM